MNKIKRAIKPLIIITCTVCFINFLTALDYGRGRTFFQVVLYISLAPVFIESGKLINQAMTNE